MTSAKQLAANRRNAQLSAGPTTAAGKNVAKMNALKHGLLADGCDRADSGRQRAT